MHEHSRSVRLGRDLRVAWLDGQRRRQHDHQLLCDLDRRSKQHLGVLQPGLRLRRGLDGSGVVPSGGFTGTTNIATWPITAQFSETVNNFIASDIVVTNGTVSGFVAVDGDTYTFNVTAMAAGAVTVNVPANRANDLAGNQNTASNTLSWTYLGGYTVQYLQPLDQSTATPPVVVVNQGKNGRVIPVKVIVSLGSVQQTNTLIAEGRLNIRHEQRNVQYRHFRRDRDVCGRGSVECRDQPVPIHGRLVDLQPRHEGIGIRHQSAATALMSI